MSNGQICQKKLNCKKKKKKLKRDNKLKILAKNINCQKCQKGQIYYNCKNFKNIRNL